MKRTVALAILGVSAAMATTALGQGVFQFSNYNSVGSPIAFEGGALVGASDGVQLEMWWAPGATTDEGVLEFGAIANFSAYAGYTDNNQVFQTPDGSTDWTVQLRASGVGTGRGELRTIAVGNLQASPPGTPTQYWNEAGFTVVIPEPSTFALAGLGAAALMIFRRRD